MADALFAEEPYKEFRNRINIWAVDAVSQDSGTDIPGEGIYVNTARQFQLLYFRNRQVPDYTGYEIGE